MDVVKKAMQCSRIYPENGVVCDVVNYQMFDCIESHNNPSLMEEVRKCVNNDPTTKECRRILADLVIDEDDEEVEWWRRYEPNEEPEDAGTPFKTDVADTNFAIGEDSIHDDDFSIVDDTDDIPFHVTLPTISDDELREEVEREYAKQELEEYMKEVGIDPTVGSVELPNGTTLRPSDFDLPLDPIEEERRIEEVILGNQVNDLPDTTGDEESIHM
eukprot:TRINITY_DN7023_c0_g1_i1.p1 TRINITY_DN7023_c0_g1~~TRINITY_DN7023_c0_g1_i1.p1  ORF type:complete len:246 (-),score=62.72 TRINITY_DN7023_c0_g1_i1:190-837(-)